MLLLLGWLVLLGVVTGWGWAWLAVAVLLAVLLLLVCCLLALVAGRCTRTATSPLLRSWCRCGGSLWGV
jgi:hypothetical protein